MLVLKYNATNFEIEGDWGTDPENALKKETNENGLISLLETAITIKIKVILRTVLIIFRDVSTSNQASLEPNFSAAKHAHLS